MTLLQLCLLAIVQGVTEFLPISSSGHLVLIPDIFGWPDQGTVMDVAVHVGSLGAVLLYFYRDVGTVLHGMADLVRGRKTPARYLFKLLFVATLPVIIAGGLLAASGAAEALRNPLVVATTTIVFGLLLYAVDKVMATVRTLEDLRIGGAVFIGLAQILALIPGTSRSGITITAARALGYDRREAARFSMLLSIPAILGSGVVVLYQLHAAGSVTYGQEFALAAAFSFVAALASLFLLMFLLKRISYTPFVIYRLFLGAALLYWFW